MSAYLLDMISFLSIFNENGTASIFIEWRLTEIHVYEHFNYKRTRTQRKF